MVDDRLRPGALAAKLLRVSVDDSGDERSLDGQHSATSRTCKLYQWREGDVYSDTASASEFGLRRGVVRKDFERLKDDLRSGVYRDGVLVVASVSRTARDIAVLEDLRKILVAQNMLWCIGNRVMDPSEPNDTLLILIEGAQAQTMALNISKDVRRGVREARSAGRAPAGRTPFGFYRPPREIGQRVIQVPHPVNGPLVARAIRYDIPNGTSLAELLRRWSDEGENAPLTRKTVRDAVLNPAVIGMTVLNGEALPGNWEPLSTVDGVPITVEEFDRARELLSDPKRRVSESAMPTSLLTGSRPGSASLCQCGLGIGLSRTRRERPHYVCREGAGSWDMEDADAFVTLRLFEEVRAAVERAKARGGGRPVVDPRVSAQEELTAAEEEYKDLTENWKGLGFTLREYAAAIKPLRERVQRAKEALSSAQPAREPVVLDADLYPALWAKMTLAEQRLQVRHFLRLTFIPGEWIEIESTTR